MADMKRIAEWILIIVVIIGLLILLFPPHRHGHPISKSKIAQNDLHTISNVLLRFEVENDRFPTTEEGLMALRIKPANCPNWDGPYLDRDPIDPWGTPYHYRYPGTGGKDFDIWSAGPDRKDGTEDDITYPLKHSEPPVNFGEQMEKQEKERQQQAINRQYLTIGIGALLVAFLIAMLFIIRKRREKK